MLLLAGLSWGGALYFYFSNVSQWSVSCAVQTSDSLGDSRSNNYFKLHFYYCPIHPMTVSLADPRWVKRAQQVLHPVQFLWQPWRMAFSVCCSHVFLIYGICALYQAFFSSHVLVFSVHPYTWWWPGECTKRKDLHLLIYILCTWTCMCMHHVMKMWRSFYLWSIVVPSFHFLRSEWHTVKCHRYMWEKCSLPQNYMPEHHITFYQIFRHRYNLSI